MPKWIITSLLIACHSSPQHAAPDVGLGVATLTATGPGRGVITSSPAGITCGQCTAPPPGTTCPDPTTACSAEFPIGTEITLTLADQMSYTSIGCVSPKFSIFGPTCTFTLDSSITVSVSGGTTVE